MNYINYHDKTNNLKFEMNCYSEMNPENNCYKNQK